MARLYELTEEYRTLQDAAEDGEDVAALLEALGGELSAKVDGCMAVVKGLEADAKAADEERKRMVGRRDSFKAEAARLREYVHDCMRAGEVKKLKTSRFTVSRTAGKEKVVFTDADAVPDVFRPELERPPPSKTLVMANYKVTGEVPEGCDIVREEGLTVR